MSTPGPSPFPGRVEIEPIYRESGRFAPGLMANARVAWRLFHGPPYDIWHFVFAPSRRTTRIAMMAASSRRSRGWTGNIVQTIASAPKKFDKNLLFGDIAVTMSEHTRSKFLAAGVDATRILTIAPCAEAPTAATRDEERALRAELDLGDSPIVLYPGDYETSTGAETVARAIRALVAVHPTVKIVFACRPKTPGAVRAKARVMTLLQNEKIAEYTRHVGELPSLAPLLSISKIVAFPVDDLYGKVDLPLVLLESLALGIPMVLARGGPLEEIHAARYVAPKDHAALAGEIAQLLEAPGDLPHRARSRYLQAYRPGVVAAAYDDVYQALK